MLCLVECKICHPYGECDVIQTVCDEVNRVRVMTPISGCDVTEVVHMSSQGYGFSSSHVWM